MTEIPKRGFQPACRESGGHRTVPLTMIVTRVVGVMRAVSSTRRFHFCSPLPSNLHVPSTSIHPSIRSLFSHPLSRIVRSTSPCPACTLSLSIQRTNSLFITSEHQNINSAWYGMVYTTRSSASLRLAAYGKQGKQGRVKERTLRTGQHANTQRNIVLLSA